MKTVGTRFKQEIVKTIMQPEKLTITLKTATETKDITLHLIYDSLNRIDWQVEDTINNFSPGEINFSMFYNAIIWDWIQANDTIQIEVKTGFDFEQVAIFHGYLDKSNCVKNSLGDVEIRALPIDQKFKDYQVSDITDWGVVNPALVKNVVTKIFTKADIIDQIRKVLPIDTDAHMDNYLDILSGQLDPTQAKICRVSDTKFFLCLHNTLYSIEFTVDMDNFIMTELTCPFIPDNQFAIKFERWQTRYVIVFGENIQVVFYGSGYSAEAEDTLARRLIFLDSDGVIKHDITLTGFSAAGKAYYPRAESISGVLDERTNVNQFVIGYNGSTGTNPYALVHYAAFKSFTITNPTSLQALKIWNVGYMPWHTWAICSGKDAYYCWQGVEEWSFQGLGYRIWNLINNGIYVHVMGGVYDTKGGAYSLGLYVILGDSNRYALNCYSMNYSEYLPSGYISHNSNYPTGSTISSSLRQVLIAYNNSLNKILLKTFTNQGTYADEYISDAFRAITYKNWSGNMVSWNYAFYQGLQYWTQYNGASLLLGIPQMMQVYAGLIFCIVVKMFMPFVDTDLFEDNDSLYTTLTNLAITYNCIFYFNGFTSGKFLSREYVGDEGNLSKNQIERGYKVWRDEIYEVLVKYGTDSEYLYGSPAKKRLTIDTGLVPNFATAAQAIAKLYYDFYHDNPYLISCRADFLVFLEIFDRLNCWQEYYAHVWKISKEGRLLELELRGVEL